MDEKNRYSPAWYELFLKPKPSDETDREVEFIARQLPRPAYRTLLDLWDAWGRACYPLSRQGIYGVESLIARSFFESGEVLVRRRNRRILPPMPYCLSP